MRYMINAWKDTGYMEERFGYTTVDLANTKDEAIKKAKSLRYMHADWNIYIVDGKTMLFVCY